MFGERFVVGFSLRPHVGAGRWRTRCGSREAAKRATPPCIFEVSTDVRCYGPVRVQAPCLTRAEDGQGRGVGTSSTSRPRSRATHPGAAAYRGARGRLPVEQVVDVPKISEDIIQPRMVDRNLRHPQMAEQLVEVPTVLSFASLQQQTVEHIVNIPVPCGRGGSVGGGGGGLQGQSYSLSSEQIVDNPVPRGRPVTGAAQRLKQRRLRSWWRHEKQSIAAALARRGPGRRVRRSPAGSGLPAWQSRRGRRSETRGASWSRSSIPHPSSRFSTPSYRRWWTQWWKR